MIDTTTIGTAVVTFIGGLLSGIVLRTKFWWSAKTTAQKKALVDDALTAFQDGKLTIDETRNIINKHM